jgi:putative iron-regulated protein
MKTWMCCVVALCAVIVSCGDDAEEKKASVTDEQIKPIVAQYSVIVEANYAETVAKAEALKVAVDAFVAAPDEAKLKAARDAWLASRTPYGLTEGYRFYGGPIDDETDGPEGQLNAWPMDEAYVDYVEGSPTAGIINDTTVAITREALTGLNEQGGETNIATGYHAIEFLLWGQDLSATGPGARPHTDYVVEGGTAANAERRAQYLTVVTDLLVDDLKGVHAQWAASGGAYRASFEAGSQRDALRDMLTGMGSLSGAELSGERMNVALENRDQEDEHSCFSDNTHNDILNNARSVQNIYLGRYGAVDGPGIDELVELVDPALNAKLKGQLEASVAAAQAIPAPFDQAIIDDAGRAKVQATIDALRAQTRTIAEVAAALDIKINLEE